MGRGHLVMHALGAGLAFKRASLRHGTHRYYVSRLGGKGNWHARAREAQRATFVSLFPYGRDASLRQMRAWFGFQNCCKGLALKMKSHITAAGLPMTFMGTRGVV